MTPAFNPNAGGVQQTTYKLGKFFTENGLDVSYFSTADIGHVEATYGKLIHAVHPNGQKNLENISHLEKVVKDIRPTVIINQMPYETNLTKALAELKLELNFLLLGCLRNSLFNFKSNVQDRMQQMLPAIIFKLMNNPAGRFIIQKRHWLKHRHDLKIILDRHDKFILLAPPNKEELEHFIGKYKSEKVLAIPNSIPEVYKNKMEKEKIILHVGRLNIAQKRSDLLLKFWESCYQQLPEWKFVIVGDGPYKAELEKNIKTKNVPRIYIEGFQKPEPYYKKASIFMMPSAYEGFPNTLLEAQSFGCAPLVFNTYQALQWIVNDKKDAFLIPAFDINKMGDKAIELAQAEKQLIAFQLEAKKNADRFTIDKVGAIWLDFFKKMVQDER